MDISKLFSDINVLIKYFVDDYKDVIKEKDGEIERLKKIIGNEKLARIELEEAEIDLYRQAFYKALNTIKNDLEGGDFYRDMPESLYIHGYIKNMFSMGCVFLYDHWVRGISVRELSDKYKRPPSSIYGHVRIKCSLAENGMWKVIDELKRKDYLGVK